MQAILLSGAVEVDPVSQESSPEQSEQHLLGRRIHPGPVIVGVVALLVSRFIIVCIPAVRFSVMAAGRAGLERITHAIRTPPASAPGNARHIIAEGRENVVIPVPETPFLQPQTTSADADSQAFKLWTELDNTAWGTPLQDWSKLYPCEPFHGRTWGVAADRQWSHRCSTGSDREAVHWYFYMFGLQEPPVSRLEQFEVMTNSLPEETLGSIQSSLQARLTARYGPPEDRSPKIGRAVSWPQYVRWNAPDIEIQLNLSEFERQRKEGRLSLQARHRALLEALKEDERLQRVGTNDFSYEAGSAIDKELAENLKSDFPDAATMLMKSQPDPGPQQIREAVQQLQHQLKAQASQQAGIRAPAGQPMARATILALPQRKWKAEEFHDALVRLLTSAQTSAPDRRPILLLAADRLAGRLLWVIVNDKSGDWDWSQWRSQLAALGVTYSPASEQPWFYGGDLLKRVWTDYSDTAWGERAFVSLLKQGWDTSAECAAGSDQFRQVIQQGIPFLEKHTKSPYQLDVRVAVAQAYETWWSLSQAPIPDQNLVTETEAETEEPDADPRQYQQGSEAARQQAIAYYTQLLQTVPQSDSAIYAARQLPRLKSGFDTGQRRFYCVVGD
jgi:hypothetical protein